TIFIVRRPQPSATNQSSAAAMTSAADFPGAYASRKTSKPRSLMRTESRTDSSSASLFTARARSNSTSKPTSSRPPSARPAARRAGPALAVALPPTREIELDVEPAQLPAAERAEVPNGQDVVEPV